MPRKGKGPVEKAVDVMGRVLLPGYSIWKKAFGGGKRKKNTRKRGRGKLSSTELNRAQNAFLFGTSMGGGSLGASRFNLCGEGKRRRPKYRRRQRGGMMLDQSTRQKLQQIKYPVLREGIYWKPSPRIPLELDKTKGGTGRSNVIGDDSLSWGKFARAGASGPFVTYRGVRGASQ